MHLAHERLQPELQAYPLHRLVVINFDVPRVVNNALTIATRLKAHRYLFLDVRPFNMSWIDNLEDYALALGHSHAVVKIAESREVSEDVPFLLAQRRQLHLEAAAAAGRGDLDPAKLKDLNHGNDHTELVYDCVGLVQLFLSAWPVLENNTGVKMPRLMEIRERANRLMMSKNNEDDRDASLASAQLDRRRSATGLVTVFRRIRGAMALVVDDFSMIEELVPPLAPRKRKKLTQVLPNISTTEEDDDGFETEDNNQAFNADDDDQDDGFDASPSAPAVATSPAKPTSPAVHPGLPGSSPIQD